LVGDAFSDIIMRTRGASGNRGKAEAARSKALQHYAAGLADDGTSRQAKQMHGFRPGTSPLAFSRMLDTAAVRRVTSPLKPY